MDVLSAAPGGPLDPDGIAAAYPWPEGRRWVRAMMVTTLDGAAAGPDGLSGSVSSAADKSVFDAVRRFADVVLVGAGTIRAERYGALRPRPEDVAARRADGLADAPVLAIVSASLDLPWSEPMFTGSTVRPIVIAPEGAPGPRLAEARRHADVVTCAGARPTAGDILDALEARGLRRIVCEGGPTLLGDLLAADLVDEADITLSPVFAGTQATPTTHMLPTPPRFDLAHVLTEDGFLMTRYLRRERG